MASSGGGGGGGGAISVQDLDPEQLLQVKEQLDQELQHLGNSFTQLRQAQAKYSAGIDSLDALRPPASSSTSSSSSKKVPLKPPGATPTPKVESASGGEGVEILVPLTPSLYVPGRLKEREKVLVDVGTGYFIEQPIPSARKSLNLKSLSLRSNLEKLQATLESKQENVGLVRELLQVKVAERERARAAAGGGG